MVLNICTTDLCNSVLARNVALMLFSGGNQTCITTVYSPVYHVYRICVLNIGKNQVIQLATQPERLYREIPIIMMPGQQPVTTFKNETQTEQIAHMLGCMNCTA